LLERSAARQSVYLTWEYLSTWLEVYGNDCKLRVLTARDDNGQLLGIAPLVIGRGTTLSRSYLRRLTFMGIHGDAAAEFLDFIIEEGREEEVAAALYRTIAVDLRKEWDILELKQVPAKSPVLTKLLTILPQHGAVATRLEAVPSPFLPLPDTWEDLLSSKSKNFKKQFKNQWNRLHKRHEVVILRAGEDLCINEAFDILIRLNHHRWGDEGQAFQSKRFVEFYRKLATEFAEKDWLYFYLMRVDGYYVAARFDFVYGDKLWNFQGGWSHDHKDLSLGRLFIGMSMQWCIAKGLKEYDFLAGDADYKRSWSSDSRTLLSVEALNPHSRRAFVFQQARVLRNLLGPHAHHPTPSSPAAAS